MLSFGGDEGYAVIRILKLSPKWIPARKNGVSVNSTVEQLQVFIISKGR